MLDITRVAVVDEHDVVIAGLKYWLSEQDSLFDVVAGFPHHTDYLTWARTHTDVDVLVTEIKENGRSPDFDCLRQLCAAGPPVIVYSRMTAAEVILSSLDCGAASYVAKVDGREHLTSALNGVVSEAGYVGPRMAEALDRCRTPGRLNLSEREKQVLLAWLQTDSKNDVAEVLHIAPATVRTHLQRVRTKYAAVGRPAPTKSALLARAVEDGIVGLSELAVLGSRPPIG